MRAYFCFVTSVVALLLSTASFAEAQYTYFGTETDGGPRYFPGYSQFSSSYGTLTGNGDNTFSYDVSFNPSYTTYAFSNVAVTTPAVTITQTASFPTAGFQQYDLVTTTFTYTSSLNDSGYNPSGTVIYGANGVDNLSNIASNLFNGSITYAGTYTITDGTQTVSGTFNNTYNTTTWSYLAFDNPSPVVDITGAGPQYDVSLNGMGYQFEMGGMSSYDLFSGTVDGVTINVSPENFEFSSPDNEFNQLQAVATPEPRSSVLDGAAIAALCFFQGWRRRHSATAAATA